MTDAAEGEESVSFSDPPTPIREDGEKRTEHIDATVFDGANEADQGVDRLTQEVIDANQNRRKIAGWLTIFALVWPALVTISDLIAMPAFHGAWGSVDWPRAFLTAATFGFSGLLLRFADRLSMPLSSLEKIEMAKLGRSKSSAEASATAKAWGEAGKVLGQMASEFAKAWNARTGGGGS